MYDYSLGSVSQLTDKKNKPWRGWIRYKDETGKWKTITKVFDYHTVKNQTDAEKEVAKWRAELMVAQEQEHTQQSSICVADYVDSYIDNLEAMQSVEPSTITGYRGSAKYIREYLSKIKLKELAPRQVQDFETALVKRGLSSSTVGKAHRLLKQVCKHAVVIDDLVKNPVDAVKPPKRKNTEPNALDAQSRVKVAEYIDTHEATPQLTAIALALYAGLHAAECAGLKWVDVDLDAAQIRVTESIGMASGGTYTKEPKNETRRRTIDIPEQLVNVLRRRRELMQSEAASIGARLTPNTYVLSYDLEHYINPNNLSKAWKVIGETLGVCGTRNKIVRFHDLRHTFATVAIAAGIDVKTVSSMMGHANASMTLNIYASSDPDAKKAAAAKIGDVYKKQADVIPFKRASNE
ncbi:MAG: site-specific integrase [Coriobacteriales bacterium]|nr:site-specific integrase [Coriobacteriales bacterium]